ncbi:MAG: ornithine cyclodeaminase family protein [Anaerolineae bacterium]|nr:ornithine cyclodeaminase family protein [Anaerolineae bacterium]
MRILDAHDIRDAVSMKDAIGAVREGFIALSAGRVAAPLRTAIETAFGSTTLTMPAHVQGERYTVVKIVSVCPDNPARDLPAINGVVFVIDAQTGAPLALMDGAFLTALRTGAASGLATDLLARPNAAVLGVIGAGVQARTQIAAMLAVRPVQQVRIYSLMGAPELAEELRQRHPHLEVRVAGSSDEAVRGASIIVTATTSREPVVFAEDLAQGVHINGVGSFTPEMQEVAADVVRRARVFVDAREGALAEAGDLIIPLRQGLIRAEDITEIGQVAAGEKPGRTSPDEVTFFKSVGNAVQDAVVASLVYQVAEARGMGQEVDLDMVDPRCIAARIE